MIIAGVIAGGRRFPSGAVSQPLALEKPAYADPNWSNVAFLVDQYYGASLGANRSRSPVGVVYRTAFNVLTEDKPASLAHAYNIPLATSHGLYISDGSNRVKPGLGGKFTIEGWVKVENSGTASVGLLYSWGLAGSRSFMFGINGYSSDFGGATHQHKPAFLFTQDGTVLDARVLRGPARAVGDWIYMAVDRDDSDDIRLYVDGVMVAKQHVPTFFSAGNLRALCHTLGNGGGSYAELRYTTGVAVYASDAGHVVPTKPHPVGEFKTGDPFFNNVTSFYNFRWPAPGSSLQTDLKKDPDIALSMANGRWFADGGGDHGGLGGAADGAGHLYGYRSGAPFDMKGMTPFTAEAWFRRTKEVTATSRMGIVSLYRTASNLRQWAFAVLGNRLELLWSANGSLGNVSQNAQAPILPLWEWVYIALTRDAAGVFRMYQNGALIHTENATSGLGLFDAMAAGLTNADLFQYNNLTTATPGDMSEFRLTRGVARYAGDTMPVPAAPLDPHPLVTEEYAVLDPVYTLQTGDDSVILNLKAIDPQITLADNQNAPLPVGSKFYYRVRGTTQGVVNFPPWVQVYGYEALKVDMLYELTKSAPGVWQQTGPG